VTLLIIGLIVFFLPHVFVMLRAPRAALVGQFGEGAYKGAYSLISAIGFVLIVWGFVQYRNDSYAPFYAPPAFGRHLGPLLILIAFVLIASANMPAGYIKSAIRHPFITGVALWAFAHLLMNGDIGGVVLFGAFLAYVIVDAIAVLRREPAKMPPPDWKYDLRAAIGGVVVFLVFAFVIHPYVFRIPVMG